MKFFYLIFFVLMFVGVFSAEQAQTSSTPVEPYPIYKAQEISNGYVPHKTFQDSYEAYSHYPSSTAMAPNFQGPLQIIMNALSRVGSFLIGGVALFVIGGIFITAICSFTSLCTITFDSLSKVDKDTMMRSFMTPEKLATAAAIVQDAVGKYQRLQKNK